MKALEQFAVRFDRLARRERALIAASALAAVIFLFHTLALGPMLDQRKRLSERLAESSKTVATLQRVKGQAHDPLAARRAERDALRKQLADVDKTMGLVQRGLVPPERTASLLEDVLRGSSGLQLVSLRTLPVRRFDTRGGGSGDANVGDNDPERQLYQHAFEMTVQGSYADIHDYLRRAEQLPWRLLWGRINVAVNPEQPSKLIVTLTVQTLSLSKAWLVV